MPTKKVATKKVTAKVAKKAVKKTAAKVAKKPAAKKAPAKKAVKKVAAKKTPSKRLAKKQTPKTAFANKELQYANDSTCFWLTDGQILDSLLALRDALETMDTEVYRYHVSTDRNDFSDWVGAVLCDEECAKALEKAKTPKSAKTVVVRHLKYYVL